MRREVAGIAVVLGALVLMSASTAQAAAQNCPKIHDLPGPATPSPTVRLDGRLVYRDGIRQWFELKLDRPICGQASVQVVPLNSRYKRLETLRGCRVESVGPIDHSPTGYYSLPLYQGPETIRPIGACARKAPLPTPSWPPPDKRIRQYRVEMHVDYSPGDHPVRFRVFSGKRELRSWGSYASYMLTGGMVLYGSCGKGYMVGSVSGPPEARPSHFTERGEPDDMATWDPETAAEAGKPDLRLGYTCVRQAAATAR